MTIKNILYVSPSSGNHTGSPRALLDLVKNIDRSKYRPSLLVSENGPLVQDFEKIGGKVFIKNSFSLSKKNIFSYSKNLKFLYYFLRHINIDLVHFNSPGWRSSAALAARLNKIPIVLHVHNKCPEKGIKSNFNFNLASKVIIVSESMRKDFNNHPNILNKTICIYNGVDLKRFNARLDNFRETASYNYKTPIIGYIGQLSHRKGVDVLVKAAPAVIKRHSKSLFLITGSDGINEEGYTEYIKNLTNDLGVRDHFLFLGKRDDIPNIMNSCDLVVVPSRSEPFGKVVIEAMACGKSVIASAVGGIPEIIQDGKNGILVPAGNVEALQQAMLKLIEDHELNNIISENGRLTAIKKFSINSLVNKAENLYFNLLNI